MSQRKINFSNEEYYHIYNKGNSKQIIFIDTYDKIRFIKLLMVMNQGGRKNLADMPQKNIFNRADDPLVAIGAYVLMDNHFHILIRQLQDDGVTKFMQKVGTAYAVYFNKKYKRTGGLFEGKFKSKHVITDSHLKYLYAYIHLNPAKMIDSNWKKEVRINPKNKQILDFISNYMFSSFQDYFGTPRPENEILSTDYFPHYFKSNIDALKNTISWLSLEDL